MKAFLLCAGLGTRFKPQTDVMAKTALPFFDLPVMAYSMFYLQELGIKSFVVNTHHLPNTVEKACELIKQKVLISTNQKTSFDFQFSNESPVILDSAGGLKKASALLGNSNPIVMINSDVVFLLPHENGLAPLIEFHKKSGAFATLLTTPHADAGVKMGGIWFDKNTKQITRLGGTHTDPGAEHFAGVFVLSPEVLAELPNHTNPAHIFKDCLTPALAKNKKILAYSEPQMLWLDMTSEKDYIASTDLAFQALQNKNSPYHQPLLKILKFYHPGLKQKNSVWSTMDSNKIPSALLNSNLFLGDDAKITDSTDVIGFAVLSEKASIDNGILEKSVVGPCVSIHEMVGLRSQFLLRS